MFVPGARPIKYQFKKEFKDTLKNKTVEWGFGGLSEFTYYRTYARKMDNGNLETWADCVIRVIEGMFTILKTHAIVHHLPWNERKCHKLAEEAAERLFTFKWTPPGRGLWMMGTDFIWERGSAALNNCAFVTTEDIDIEISKPFAFLMDMSMLGVGVGFDTKGAGKAYVTKPEGEPELVIVDDSREGWVELISCLIDSYLEEGSYPIIYDTSKVRKYGEPIRGFGGVASGPEPLEQGFRGIKTILENRIESFLTSTDIVDIMNIIGKIVVAGNVRRTAEIAFGDPNDKEFTEMKHWDKFGVETGSIAPLELKEINPEEYELYNTNWDIRNEISKKYSDKEWSYKFGGWRWASNNSLFGEVGMDYTEAAKSIVINGEPGFAWLDNMRKYGRFKDGINNKDYRVGGGNPCITSDTNILTTEGSKKVEELIGKKFTALVNGKSYNSTEIGFWRTGKKPVYEIELHNGLKVKATSNHKFLTKENQWKELNDLHEGDSLSINNNTLGENKWNNDIGSREEGYYIGQLIGDGTFSNNGEIAVLTLFVNKKFKQGDNYNPYHYLQNWLLELPSRSDFKGFNLSKETNTTLEYRAKCVALKEISNKFKVFANEKKIPEFGSKEFTIGLLQGLFDSDGSVQGTQQKGVSIRLTQTELHRLESVQRLLLNLGIVSTIYKNREKEGYKLLPDGKGDKKEYLCKARHELIISNKSIIIFNKVIGFLDNDKKSKLMELIKDYKRKPNKSKYYSSIKNINYIGELDVFDCTIEKVHRFSANGIIAHNCLEQSLEPYELCCLVESYPAKHNDYWDFQRTLKFAYLYAKIVTLMGTHWTETNAVMSRNRRIGCSQSGIIEAINKFGRRIYFDNYCDQAYGYIKYVDKKYSEWLGIPRSIKTTSVKPSGTVSLVAGSLPGIHYAESSSYYRTVRLATISPLVKILKESNYRVESAVTDPLKTVVVYFPVLHDENTISKESVSIWEQFKNARDMNWYWSDNQVSITVTFKPEESDYIARCLSAFDTELKGISLLPLSTHGYAQAPYIDAPRKEIEEYKNSLLPLNFSKLNIEEGENADATKFCEGDVCMIN